MPVYFICDHKAIDDKLLSLIKTSTSDDGWTQYYKDEHTQELWILTRYHGEYHGGGYPILKKLPQLPVSQLITIALTSDEKDDILGASVELYEREQYHDAQFRKELLEALQQMHIDQLSDADKWRIRTLIIQTALHHPINRKEIVGKHWTKIREEAEFYKGIAEQAKHILDKIGE